MMAMVGNENLAPVADEANAALGRFFRESARSRREAAGRDPRAGFAGHTAALHLSHLVRGKADVTVVAPRNRFTWFPS